MWFLVALGALVAIAISIAVLLSFGADLLKRRLERIERRRGWRA